ncbi:hypothetical protein Q5762_06815 [Streptomyces sp. P9(2023)]|uniref:hypothetical protein n=1 Tax=Streptomyces sp. P9(2023) TaxID=3064394 RepID=UPI0028F429DB|nr:hypothetical protein [Streptomyces sp. P9(2023)]MDT9688066.1 hypothetical protein [Streptomyces sp. P9(2023)]
MSTQELAPSPLGPVDVEQAEAALVEHYQRLVRIAYLVLPPSLGRNRRVLTSHALVQGALPRRRTSSTGVPGARRAEDAVDPGYAYVRGEVLRQALVAGLPLRRRALPRRAQLPPLLPQVWGLRLFPRAGGADELALDQQLSALSGPARAAYVLRGLERQGDPEVLRVLGAAGVPRADAEAALTDADEVTATLGIGTAALLESPEFDPCSLQARPPDLMRRRQHGRAALAAAAAALVCGALLGLPGDGWGRGGAAAPSYARNPAAEAALDPGKLRRVPAGFWQGSTRTDFSVWPARGGLVDDRALLRRALAVWARPGASVRSSATPGTPVGPPMGPPQLLYAGEVDGSRVVLFHDGLRAVRYAEPLAGTAGAALDFGRTDGADAVGSAALVLSRTTANVRYLTAPWVRDTAVRDLLAPAKEPWRLERDTHGVTEPLLSPAQARGCTAWNTLQVRDATGVRLLTDLGELAPARLTSGPPSAPKDVTAKAARDQWARAACGLTAVRSHGVRSVNAWAFAEQRLPEDGGRAAWVCTRAETWRGTGSRVLAQFQVPAPGVAAAVVARAEESPACGVHEPRVLAGVLWQAKSGRWYVLAAGSGEFVSLRTTGGVKGEAESRLLAVRAKAGARADLDGTLKNGTRVGALR